MGIVLIGIVQLAVVADDTGQVLMLAYHCRYHKDIALVGCAYSQGGRYTGENEVGVLDHYACQGYVAVVGDYHLEPYIAGYCCIGTWRRVGVQPCKAAVH